MGRPAAGPASWPASRSRSRRASCSSPSIVEVAHRVGGIDAAVRSPSDRRGTQFDPLVVDTLRARRGQGLRPTSTMPARGTRVIDAEPSLAVALSTRRVRRGAAGDQSLRRSEVAVHDRALRGGRRARDGRPRTTARSLPMTKRGCCTAPGWSTTSAGSACRTRSGTSVGRSGPANGNASACTRTSPSGCCISRRRSRRSPASRCNTVSGSTAAAIHAASAGAHLAARLGLLAAADAYQSMREPRAPPGGTLHGDEPRPSCGHDVRRRAPRRDAVEAVLAAAGHRASRREEARPADRTRGRRAPAGRPWLRTRRSPRAS